MGEADPNCTRVGPAKLSDIDGGGGLGPVNTSDSAAQSPTRLNGLLVLAGLDASGSGDVGAARRMYEYVVGGERELAPGPAGAVASDLWLSPLTSRDIG
jgi:hypothetical protein